MSTPSSPTLETRLKRDRDVSAALTALNDAELRVLLGTDSAPTTTGALTSVAQVAGTAVFVKRLNLTTKEREHPFSTANVRDLSLTHPYGNGEPGLAWRELAANITTSTWVRDGDTEHFPLLHHYRMLDGAQTELVLVFEYIPYVLSDWIDQGVDDNAAAAMFERAWSALDLLRARGLTHFDAHWANILTDGTRLYFADLGLAVAEDFALSEGERTFWQEHASTYDYALFTRGLLRVILRCPGFGPETNARILQAPDIEAEAERAQVPKAFTSLLARYGELAWIAFTFMNKVKSGERAPYPRRDLERAIAKARGT